MSEARNIAEERFARGEISKEEFEEILSSLSEPEVEYTDADELTAQFEADRHLYQQLCSGHWGVLDEFEVVPPEFCRILYKLRHGTDDKQLV